MEARMTPILREKLKDELVHILEGFRRISLYRLVLISKIGVSRFFYKKIPIVLLVQGCRGVHFIAYQCFAGRREMIKERLV
ncbi:MAG: hypothetical protein NTY61_01230 [Candidatus Parcubacteria bacterium]|nr:hypothetical protein [Candidatus Parcubacteria bacterium]